MIWMIALSSAQAGYYRENFEIVATRGNGVALVTHVMAAESPPYIADYRILHGASAERCSYEQEAHDSLYSAAAGTESSYLSTAASVMPPCWGDLTSSEKSESYQLYRAMRGASGASADWTVEVHRVVPALAGVSETLAQADFASLRSAAEQGFSSFSSSAASLLVLEPDPWGDLDSPSQSAVFEAFDWMDGD